jgi:OOP family OmpA-OmpF porin
MRKIFSMYPIFKKIAPVLFVSVFLLPLSARSEIKAGSVEVSPFAGVNFFDTKQNLEIGPIIGGRLGYNFTDFLGIEATAQYIRSGVDDRSKTFTRQGQFTSPTKDVNVIMYHLDLLYHFLPEGRFNPFIVAGYGAANYDPKISNKNMSILDFGVGAKYWMTDNIALRADARDNMVFDEHLHNLEATMGVVFRFGGNSKTAAAPVVADSDGDGVPDTLDKCPGTPAGVAVDKDGCPIDSDGDGVPDYLDKCPDTPAGVAVDKDGCPFPEKVVILASEPKVEEVVTAVSQKKAAVIVLAFQDIHFDFDQSTLTPEAKIILKRDIKLLKDNPNAKIRVAGYTSASGTEEYNQKLSERRAKAVEEYLISEGIISRGRLSMIGYGEHNPAVYESSPKELYSPAAKANMRVLFEIVVQ